MIDNLSHNPHSVIENKSFVGFKHQNPTPKYKERKRFVIFTEIGEELGSVTKQL